jgi:FKBP-type peptidyl-prolyl cis-trans isomerase FkpA
MKKILVFLALAVSLMSCKKEPQGCKNVDPKDEEAQLLAFASQNGFSVTKHSSGIYYQILTQGSAVTPTGTSKIFITYTGKLLNGTTFDSQSNPSQTGWQLNQLIEGWKIGLPLIQKGGSIRLLIPSAYSYGCTGAGGGKIPSNSPLFFEINLIDVQ